MFRFNYKHGLFLISLLFIICLSLSVVSAVEDSTLNNLSDDSDSIMVVSKDIENSQDIEVSNVEISSNNDKNSQEISNVSADKTFATIQQQINSASSGSTIKLSGTYVGSGSQIILNKTLTIDGCGATLNGNKLSRIFSVTASNCIIKNINFINGYDVNYKIDNSGVIAWSGASGTLINCTFVGAYASSNGGSIYWSGSKGTINNCTFINSHASYGGSIYWAGNNGTLSNSNFINSSASTYGGSLYWSSKYGKIYNCSFNNSIDTSYSGGAIYIVENNGLIYDSIFFNCSSNADGGAIYLGANNITIRNCNFTKNHATNNGGGISVSKDASSTKVDNCIFDECSASSGGAIYLDNNTKSSSAHKIINSTFKNCSATYAGAIYILGDSNLIDYCNFLDCKATASGGAISFACANSLLNNSYFNNCHSVFAGAIYLTGDSSSVDCSNFTNCNCMAQTVLVVSGSISWAGNYGKLSNCNFINSTASCLISSGWIQDQETNAYGGSVSWYGSNGLVDNCNFINSTIDDTLNTYGGAIYWVGNNGSVIDSIFFNCSISGGFSSGGAIYWDSADGEIAFCTFTNSSCDAIKTSVGGSIYLNNVGSSAVLTNCTFEDSNADEGKVIYSESTKEIYNSSFIMKSDDVASDMVYGVSLDTLINQLNKFVLKSITTTTDFSSKYGSKVNLTANVKNIDGLTINEGSVTFYKNGTKIGTANVVNGKATYTYTVDDEGIFDFKAVYTGSNNYGSSIATSKLYIEKVILETNISAIDVSSSYNKTINLTANVTNENLVVNEGIVTFYIGDYVIATANVINGSATCSYKCNVTGSISIKVVYTSSNHFYSSNTTFNLNVAKLNTDVVVNPVDASYGKSIDLSATVKVDAVNIDGGIVKFYVNGSEVGSGTVSNGVAIYSYTPLIVGTFTYKVEYQGSDYYNPSNASSSLHIDSIATKIIVDSVSTNYGTSVNLSATVKTTDNILVNNGIVRFYVNGSEVGSGTVSDGRAICPYTCNITGNFIIKAVYEGPTGFNSSTNNSTLSVSSKGTITTLDFGSASYGGVVEFVACVSSPNAVVNEGTIKFYIDNEVIDVDVVEGVARYNYTCSNIGTFNIKAVYTGSNIFEGSTSDTKQLVIDKVNTITTINDVYAVYGKPVTITASVKTIEGNLVNEGVVKFYVGNRLKATVNVSNGVVSFNYTFEGLEFFVEAIFNGSNSLNNSNSSTNVFVNNLTTVVTVNNISANYGEHVTLTATVSADLDIPTSPNSYVTFYVGDFSKKVRVSNGVATCSYDCNNAGDLIIKADYLGTTGFSTSSGTGNLKINGLATSTTVNSISTSYNDTVDLTATVRTVDGSVVTGGIVIFYINGSEVGTGTVSDGVATYSYICNKIGDSIIRADYVGNAAYASSTNTSSLSVNKLNTVITMESASISSNNTITLRVGVHSNIPVNEGNVIFYMNGTKITNVTVNNGVATLIYDCEEFGIFEIKANYTGSEIFNSSILNYTLNIDSLKTIITINSVDANYNDTIDLTATVKTDEDEIVDEGNVIFYIGTLEIANVPVNEEGIATYSYICNNTGNLTINVRYSGSIKYDSSTNSSTLKVNPLNTSVSVSDIYANYGDSVTLNASVITIDNQLVNEGIVIFYIGDKEIGRNATNNGIATYNYICNNVSNFNIMAVYEGPSYFKPSNSTFKLKVNKVNTSILADDIDADYNETLNIEIPINSVNGAIVDEGTVKFYMDDDLLSTGVVDNGFVTFTYTCNITGNFNVKIVYEGTDSFNPSNSTFKLSVATVDTKVIINNVTASYGDVIILNATVEAVDGSNINNGSIKFYVDGVLVGEDTVSNGVASCSYNCGEVGDFTINVLYTGYNPFNSSNSNSTLKVNPASTIISVNNVNASYNDSVVLNASVKTIDNVNIDEGVVKFYVNGFEVGSGTVINGLATCSYNCTNVSDSTIRVTYVGTNNYTSSNNDSILHVSPISTIISVNSVVASYNDSVVLNASVKTINNVNINEGNVTFYVNGAKVETVVVVDGVAYCSYDCGEVGDFTIEAVYEGSTIYASSSDVSILCVSPISTLIIVDSVVASYNDSVVLNASVKTIDNVNIDDGVVKFYVNGFEVGSGTVSNGVAICPYICNVTGNFTIRADYGGYKYYNASTNSSKLEVNALDVIMNPGTVYSSNFTADLVVYIKTLDNLNVNEGTVTFYVNDNKVGNSNVVNGAANYKYHYDVLGEYEVKYVYSGSTHYNNNTSNSTFKTSSLATLISADPIVTVSGDVVTLTAIVRTIEGIPVNEGTVTFSKINGEDKEIAYINNGVASCSHIFNSQGIFDYNVVYNGAEYFDQSSTLITVTVGYLPTVTTVSSPSSTYGNTVTLTAKVTSDTIVNEGQVTFYVAGTKVGSSYVNSNGIATCSYTCKKTGTLNLKAVYGSSNLFNESTGSSSLVVSKAQATMTVTVPSTCYYKGTKLTIKLVDSKTKKGLAKEKITITIGTTKTTVTTNSNGIATYNVALVPKSYNSKYVLSSSNYNSNSPSKVIKIVKATSVTLAPTTLSTTYNSKKAFQVKVYKGSVLFVGVKVKLKVYTGKKYKTVTITTGTNGIAQYKDASVLSVAKHKVIVSCGESTKYMTASAKTKYITVKKAPTTVSAPKVTNKYKKSAYFKVTIKMQSTGYTVPAGVTVKIKVYTGKKYKTYTVKTNSKGVAQLNTKSLSKGTHKVVISSGHSYYTISKSGNLIVIK